jgi:hypothetical protein
MSEIFQSKSVCSGYAGLRGVWVLVTGRWLLQEESHGKGREAGRHYVLWADEYTDAT